MEATTQPSIDPLARAAFAADAPAAGPRLDRLAGWLATGASVIATLAAWGLLVALVGGWAGGYRYQPLTSALESRAPKATASDAADGGGPGDLRKLEGEHRKLLASLERKTPRGKYIVVDRTNNLIYLRDSEQVLLDTICSAGSGHILKDPAGNRTWVFDTPRGMHKVITILKNPIWRKPDWAFIEEGQPIPKDPRERFEPGTLGEYGLYFGDGFLIHGTLYERLLGRNVTHGCIRVGKLDLRQVVQETRIGTKIFIF
jgi:L,D-transpeptidase YbiS